MKFIILISLINYTLANYHHFSEEIDQTIRPKGDLTKCLTLYGRRKIKFATCPSTLTNKQKWIVQVGNFFGRVYKSLHFVVNPYRGRNNEMCVTVNRNNLAIKVSRCKNKFVRGGWPRQLFDMLGDEDQLSIPRDDGSKRDCLVVNSATGKIRLGECDASVCNNGRDLNFACSSCAWRNGLEGKCDYCKNRQHVLTDDGDCIDINSVSKCTEKYPMGHTLKHLQWYHLQGTNYCLACDTIDESKCLENACPQRYNTAESHDGKCRCPPNSSVIQVQSGGPFIAYSACVSNKPGNQWATHEFGQNWNCLSNSFQTAPESKCDKCMWYMQFFCSSCVTKGAEVFIGNPGNRMYCVCPAGFRYKVRGDKCVRI